MDENGKCCWASMIKNALFKHGFGYVLLAQSVGCEKTFVCIFKQRLIDMCRQEWNSSIAEKDMYRYHRPFKCVIEPERYFEFVTVKCFRNCLVKLRLGLLPLYSSAFILVFQSIVMKACPYCKNDVVEDEVHFVCTWPLYRTERVKYFGFEVYNSDTFKETIKCKSLFHSRKHGAYLFYASNIRTLYIESIT